MNAIQIQYLFLFFLTLETLNELFLLLLNNRHVQKHRDAVPPLFQESIDAETYKRSVAYTIDKNRFAIAAKILSAACVLIVVSTGFLGTLDQLVQTRGWHPYLEGLLYLLVLSFLVKVLSLPLALYGQFILEARYGFNRMSLGLFFLDLGKGVVLQIVLLTPLLGLLFWFMDATGEFWWIWAFGFVCMFQLLLTVLYPLVIAPLFNKFTPLEEGSLKEKVVALAEKLGFRAKGVFVMDGSKRTRHSNAYFSGFGRVKRIVLFDTLIQTLTEDQTCAVLAHELGHEKKKHIVQFFILSSSFILLGLYIVNLFLHYQPLFQAFGFGLPGYHRILAILTLSVGPFTFFLDPLINGLSRRFEYQADRFAAKKAGLGAALASALLVLGRENLTNLTPHPWYSFYHYSHPTLGERIEALRKL